MANQTIHRSRNRFLCCLVLAFLFGSGVWLKLILSDVLAFDLSYDLLYEREFLPESRGHWRVARGLNITVDLSDCTVRHSTPTRRMLAGDESSNSSAKGAPDKEAELNAVAQSPSPSPPPSSPPCPLPPPSPCSLSPPSPIPLDPNSCSIDQVEIVVNATLETIEKPIGPLYFVVYFSQDWTSWHQASKIDLNEALFAWRDCPALNGSADPACRNSTEPGKRIEPVSVKACVGNPGFTYLVGCVLEGFTPGHRGEAVYPPFSTCVAIDGVCGASCNAAVVEPTYNDPSLPSFHQKSAMHCVKEGVAPIPTIPLNQGDTNMRGAQAIYHWRNLPSRRTPPEVNTQGVIRLDDIEAYDLFQVGLGFPSYLFGCMYVLGVLSLFLMYAPSIGQREGVAPTWNRLKQTILSGKLRLVESDRTLMRRSRRPTEWSERTTDNGIAPVSAAQPWPTQSLLGNGGPLVGAASMNGAPLPSEARDAAMSDARLWIGRQGERGIVPCLCSISATESFNVVLRNGLGKITANLRILSEMADGSELRVTIVDLFVDEGHRLGAYYLYKSLALCFYVCIPRHVALKIASGWLKKMNTCQGAKNVDEFGKIDLFELLDARTRDRSEIRLLEFVHKLAPVMNQFVGEVKLFDKMLDLPILDPVREQKAVDMVNEMPTIKEGPEDDELDPASNKDEDEDGGGGDDNGGGGGMLGGLFGGSNGSSSSSLAAGKRRMDVEHAANAANGGSPMPGRRQSLDHVNRGERDDDELSNVSVDMRDAERIRCQTTFKSEFGFSKDAPIEALMSLYASRRERTARTVRKNPVTLRAVLDVLIGNHQERHILAQHGATGVRDSTQSTSAMMMNTDGQGESAHTFFHPLLWQKLGGLIISGYEGKFEARGERSVPVDVAAYRQALEEFGKEKPENFLDSHAWISMRPLFRPGERDEIKHAMFTKKYAFDHVQDVLRQYNMGGGGQRNVKVMAVYAARANPTLWQPWTKTNHRRVMKAGVWISRKVRSTPPPPAPSPTTREALGAPPRRDIEGGGGAERTFDAAERMAAADLRARYARDYWESRKRVGLLLGNQKMAYFFRNDDEADDMPEPDEIDPSQYDCLNRHLGKAGGLNFGLHAVAMLMAEARDPPPSQTNPLFFAIIDARHACDQRLWLQTLPPFFFADEHSNVTFQKDVCLVQIAHNYLGLENSTDFLDMRNDFLFTGMAVIRNQAYGMTSCGTGGIWAIAHTNHLEEYFFGRTMIEDTASSINEFLKGHKAVYVAPFANRPSHDQLMCAVPKVSQNYLEALERWDTGAIQCLCALALGRPWFWLAFPLAFTVMATITVPSWYPLGDIAHVKSWQEFLYLFEGPRNYPGQFWLLGDGSINVNLLVLLLAVLVWVLLFVAFFILTYLPKTLNFVLRMCVCYFNVTYPLNSIATVFWISIPPWICIGGAFPFKFNPVFAIVGSLFLRAIEWSIMLSAKKEATRAGSHLAEFSIFRSQQMNLVSCPIKLRACVLGFQTGWNDVVRHHDNSFWTSFGGTAAAIVWVQAWVCTCCLAMLAAFVGGIVNIILHWNTRDHATVLAACSFGMVLASIQLWVLFEPTLYVMQGRRLKLSLRHTEVLVLLAIGVAVIVMTGSQLNGDAFKAFNDD